MLEEMSEIWHCQQCVVHFDHSPKSLELTIVDNAHLDRAKFLSEATSLLKTKQHFLRVCNNKLLIFFVEWNERDNAF